MFIHKPGSAGRAARSPPAGVRGRATQSVQWDSAPLQNGSELSSHPLGTPLFDHPKRRLSIRGVDGDVGEDPAYSLGKLSSASRETPGDHDSRLDGFNGPFTDLDALDCLHRNTVSQSEPSIVDPTVFDPQLSSVGTETSVATPISALRGESDPHRRHGVEEVTSVLHRAARRTGSIDRGYLTSPSRE